MRSIVINENFVDKIVISDKDKLHHFNNVIRIKKDEEVLVLDGIGKKRIYQIKEINKKSITLKSSGDIVVDNKNFFIDILIGVTKKDDLSNILSSCVELSVNKIIIAKTDYSQKNELDNERIKRILHSAQEQSNNALTPEVIILNGVNDLEFKRYNKIFVFHPYENEKKLSANIEDKILIVIGPEGGFSNNEISLFRDMWKTKFIKFQTPILRARTAVPAAFGYIYKMILEQ